MADVSLIRRATIADSSRLAEILIFTKRMNYRRIFRDDAVSFGEMQVYPLAKHFMEDHVLTGHYYVYDDGIVKGLLHIEGREISELYVEDFFQGEGIGACLMSFARDMGCDHLWVLEKNERAQRFYRRNGFEPTGERVRQEPTREYMLGYELSAEEAPV